MNTGRHLCMPLEHSPNSATPITSLPFWPSQDLLLLSLLRDLMISLLSLSFFI